MQTSKGNKGVREACDWCHTRKIRCIPTESSDCRACAQHQRICQFSRPEKMGRPKSNRRKTQGDSTETSDISWAVKQSWQTDGSEEWLFSNSAAPDLFQFDQSPSNTNHWLHGSPSEMLNHHPSLTSSNPDLVTAMAADEMDSQPQERSAPYVSRRLNDKLDDQSGSSSQKTRGSLPQDLEFAALSAIHLDIDRLCPRNLGAAQQSAKIVGHEELFDKVSTLCGIVRGILGSAKTREGEGLSPPCLDEPFPFLVFSTMLKVITSYQSIIDACSKGSDPISELLSSTSNSLTRSPEAFGDVSLLRGQAKDVCLPGSSTIMGLMSIDLHKLHNLNIIDNHLLHFMHLVLLLEYEPTLQEPNILSSVRHSRTRLFDLHRRLQCFISPAYTAWRLLDTQGSCGGDNSIGLLCQADSR